jgi:uncharacterized membrane protein YhdT
MDYDKYELSLAVMFAVFYTHIWRVCAYMPDDQRDMYSLVVGFYCAQFYTRLFYYIALKTLLV